MVGHGGAGVGRPSVLPEAPPSDPDDRLPSVRPRALNDGEMPLGGLRSPRSGGEQLVRSPHHAWRGICGSRRRTLRLLLLAPVVIGAFLAAAAGGLAYVTAAGTGSGLATNGTLLPPTAVTVPPTSTGTVPVSWVASAADGGAVAPQGYVAERFDGTAWSAACGSSSSLLVSGTSCNDTGVANGSYAYRVTAVYRTWTARSAASGTVVVNGDVTPPSSAIAFPAASGAYNTAGWAAGCSNAVCGSAADTVGGSGIARVEVSVRAPGGLYWNGISFGSATEVRAAATGTTSWALAFPAANFGLAGGGEGTYLVRSYASDAATNVQSPGTSATFVVDNTAPSDSLSLASSPAPVGAFKSGTTLYYRNNVAGSFRLVDTVTDTLSGPASATFTAASAWGHPLETVTGGFGSGQAIAYTSSTYSWGIGGVGPGPQATSGKDVAGNVSSPGAAWVPTLDNAAPTGGSLTVKGQVATAGGSTGYSASAAFTIGARTDFADVGSGLASSVLTVQSFFLASADGVTAGACGAASAPFASPVTVTGTTQPAGIVTGRCYRYVLSGTDNVGNAASVTTTVKVDASAPSSPALSVSGVTGNTYASGSTVFVNPQAGRSGSFSVSATTTDADSGIASVVFPALSGFASGGGTDTSPPFSSGTYSWSGVVGATGAKTVTATNNASMSAGASFTVAADTTGPTGSPTPASVTVNGVAATGSGATSATSSTTFAITNRSDYTSDSGSGLASSALTIQSASLTDNAVCGAAGSGGPYVAAQIIAGTANPPITAGFCYAYTLVGTDHVGNASTLRVTVMVTAPVVSTTATSIAAGGTVTVTWSGLSGPTTTDWIGLYAADDPNAYDYVGWIYTSSTSCGQSAGPAPLASGSCTFTIPASAAPGTYNLRLFPNNVYAPLLATSSSFTVTPRPTVASLAITNKAGGTVGRPEAGDRITIVYSGALDTSSFCSGWSGSGSKSLTGATLTISNNRGNDTIDGNPTGTTSPTCAGGFKLGTFALGGNYVSGDTTFGSTTISYDATTFTLTLTLGAVAGSNNARTMDSSKTATYTPDGSLTDPTGTPLTGSISATAVHF